MGVVNVTPDSFSDGGKYFDPQAARDQIDRLVAEGAGIIDVGGESTRPGSKPVPAEEQMRRTSDAVRYAADRGVIVSIDTFDPTVARHAIEQGATIINDVSCLRDGPALAEVAARAGTALIVMHAREPMDRMKGYSVCDAAAYDDVVQDVRREWRAAAEKAARAGVPADELLFDPGLGFNKSEHHSNELVARLDELRDLGHAIVVGPSRKSFLTATVKAAPDRRLGGTVAACIACAAHGADVLRVHDVLEVRQALAVSRAVARPYHEVGHA